MGFSCECVCSIHHIHILCGHGGEGKGGRSYVGWMRYTIIVGRKHSDSHGVAPLTQNYSGQHIWDAKRGRESAVRVRFIWLLPWILFSTLRRIIVIRLSHSESLKVHFRLSK